MPVGSPVRQRSLAALARIATSPPPIIDAPPAIDLRLPQTYMQKTGIPDHTTAKEIGSFVDLSLLGMDTKSRVAKRQNGVILADDRIEFHVDIDCRDGEMSALVAAAHNVPYFGSSKNPADLSVTANSNLGDSPTTPLERWYGEARAGGRSQGWQSNTIEWFEINFQRIHGSDVFVGTLPPVEPSGYVLPLNYSKTPPPTHLEFPIAALPRSVPHHRIPEIIDAVNSAADLPVGWTAFAITVSHETAETNASGDGRCVGIGLAPDEHDRRSAGDIDAVATYLARMAESVGAVADGFTVGQSRALRPASWIGPAKSWYSTTPLRAYPDERVARWQISEQLRDRYGVEITELTLQHNPRIANNGRWAERDVTDGYRQWWAEFTVSAPIDGPLLLGQATARGFGTFRPRSRS